MISGIDRPYPGLRPFEQHEVNIFFGRQDHVNQVLNKLKTNHFLAIVGSSGSGKSSLIKAGVIPSLSKGYMGDLGTNWLISEMRPGSQPFTNLAQALQFNNQAEEVSIATKIFAAQLRQSTYAVREFFDESGFSGEHRLLILVDQFEELFRYHNDIDSEQASAFVATLLDAAKHDGVFIIITMRSDYLGHTSIFSGLPEAINEGLYLTPKLKRKQLNEAICLPALLYGGKVDPILANNIINEASNAPDHLPLLQHALMQIWEHDEDKVLTFEEYKKANGLKQILNDHLDSIFDSKLSEDQKISAKEILTLLAEKTDDGKYIRRPNQLLEIIKKTNIDEQEVIDILDVFRAEGRNFITPNKVKPLTEKTVIDISHESLIRQWQKLREWIDADHERHKTYKNLLNRARQCQNKKGELLKGLDLKHAQQWMESQNKKENPEEKYGTGFLSVKEFYETSLNVNQNEIRSKKKRRITNASIFSFLLLLLGGAIAWNYNELQIREAEKKTFEAERKAFEATLKADEEEARANTLEKSAEINDELAKIANERAILQKERADAQQKVIALQEQLEESQQGSSGDSAQELEEKLTNALKQIKQAEKKISDAEKAQQMSGKELEQVQANLNNKNKILDASIYSEYDQFAIAREKLSSVDLKSLYPHELIQAQLLEGQLNASSIAPQRVIKTTTGINDIAIDPTRKVLLAAGYDGMLYMSRTDNKDDIAHSIETDLSRAIQNISIHPSNHYFLTTGDNAKLTLWQWTAQADKPEQRQTISSRGAIKAATFNPDGTFFVTGHVGPTGNVPIRLWNVESKGRELSISEVPDTPLTVPNQVSEGGLVFLTNQLLASLSHGDDSSGGHLKVWDITTKKEVFSLQLDDRLPLGIDLSPDKQYFSVSDGTTIRVFETDGYKEIKKFVTDHKDAIHLLKWIQSPSNEDILISGDLSGKVFLWQPINGIRMGSLDGHKLALGSVGMAYNPDTSVLYTPDGGGILEWELFKGNSKLVPVGESKIRGISFNTKSDHILTASDEGQLVVYEPQSFKVTDEVFLSSTSNRATHIAKHPTENIFAVAYRESVGRNIEGRLQLFTINTKGKAIARFKTPFELDRRIESLTFSGDGERLYTSGLDGKVGLVDLEAKQPSLLLTEVLSEDSEDLQIRSIDLSKDGKYLLTARRRVVKIWELADNGLPKLPHVNVFSTDLDLYEAAFIPDNSEVTNIVTVGSSGMVSKYTLDQAGEITKVHDFFGHSGAVYDVGFIPDASVMLTGSTDATLRGWDLRSNSQLFDIKLPSENGYPPPFYDFDHSCKPSNCRFAIPLRRKLNGQMHFTVYQFDLDADKVVKANLSNTLSAILPLQ